MPQRDASEGGSGTVPAVSKAARRPEGLSLPVDVLLRAVVECDRALSPGSARRCQQRWSVGGASRPRGAQAEDTVRRPDHRLAGWRRVGVAPRRVELAAVDLQPTRAGNAAGHRRLAPLRPAAWRAPGRCKQSPTKNGPAVQHPPLQGAARRLRSPTPACPPMRAAAKPAQVDYLYYVRKPDGVHHFFTADEDEFCAKAVSSTATPGC